MATFPHHITIIPSVVIGEPFMETVPIGAMFNSGIGLEFDEAVAIRVCSEKPFYFAFADNDADGAAKTAANPTRGWRPAGIWIFAFYAEERNFYIRSADAGIISVERLKALSSVEEEG